MPFITLTYNITYPSMKAALLFIFLLRFCLSWAAPTKGSRFLLPAEDATSQQHDTHRINSMQLAHHQTQSPEHSRAKLDTVGE